MKNLIFLFFIFCSSLIYGQSYNNLRVYYGEVIGSQAQDQSAILDVQSTYKGFLTPRMTTYERSSIISPATGLMIYNTSINAFNYYNGSTWNYIGNRVGNFRSDFQNYSLVNDTAALGPYKIPFTGSYAEVGKGLFFNGFGNFSAIGQLTTQAEIGYLSATGTAILQIDTTNIRLQTTKGDTGVAMNFYANGNNVDVLFNLQSKLPNLGYAGYETQIVSGKNTATMFATNYDGTDNLSAVSIDTVAISIHTPIFKITDLQAFPNNAAAVSVIGQYGIYYTDVAGEYILKIAH